MKIGTVISWIESIFPYCRNFNDSGREVILAFCPEWYNKGLIFCTAIKLDWSERTE